VETLSYVTTALVAYLLGSVPTGFLVAQAKGIDIRSVGSGNIGATNVFRILGKPAGVLVLLVDAVKGFLACAVVPMLLYRLWGSPQDPAHHLREWLAITGGLAAVLGHNYTVWLWFRGGKGIATSAGVLIALVPYALLAILAVWIVVFALTRYVSLGSIAASFSLPFMVWLVQRGSSTMVLITAAMAVLAIYKHRGNIRRLLRGTEDRIQWRRKTEHHT
jgi:glycerol-3-phosphate acyltransferase PlsY